MTRLSSESAVAAGEAGGMEPPHNTTRTYLPPINAPKGPEPGRIPTSNVALAGGSPLETPHDRAASEQRLNGVCAKESPLALRRSRKRARNAC